jgi:hypothetical protein
MSMNIYISAFRTIRFTRKDGTEGSDMQEVRFDSRQTPTKVTYNILHSDDPAQAYIDWLRSNSVDEVIPTYAEDDHWCEGVPTGSYVFNAHEEHIKEFQEWLLHVEAEGFTVQYDIV